MNPQNSNPNDFKVVSFHNSEDFDFTPDLGCMFNSKAIHGQKGTGITSGETFTLPYHVAQQLALNLAKAAMTRRAPAVDQAGIPTGVPLWDLTKLESLKNSYLTDLYSEEKPTAMTEVDKLMAKVDELNKFVKDNVQVKDTPSNEVKVESKVYQDKAEVLAELEKRGIKHDKRSNKETLEKLLA